MELLQQSYHSLTSKKIKDTLSSFLPDIPGKGTQRQVVLSCTSSSFRRV